MQKPLHHGLKSIRAFHHKNSLSSLLILILFVGFSLTSSEIFSSNYNTELYGIGSPCENGQPYLTRVFDGTETLLSVSCVYAEEYNLFENAEAGNQYEFTGTQNTWITVREGSPDGTVLAYGYSPVTAFPDADGTLFVHYNGGPSCETNSDYCIIATGQCITCGEDLPSNNTPCEAITLDCNATISGTTLGATPGVPQSGNCLSGNQPSVFYKINVEVGYYYTVEVTGSSNFDPTLAIINPTGSCAEDFILAVCASATHPNGTQETVGINVPLNTLPVRYVQVFDHNGNEGDFDITFTCTSILDCPALDANIGDPCDDGDPETNNDLVTEGCECAGNLPCLASVSYQGATMDGSNQIIQISSGNLINDFSTILNVTSGDQYTFVSTDNLGTDPIYITVRSGTVDGPVLGSGYSPLTVTSDVDGALYPHYSTNEFCDFNSIGGFTSTVQCITCPEYCPTLDLAVGAPCDDGNPDTTNDTVNEDCECAGTGPCQNEVAYTEVYLNGSDDVQPLSSCVFEGEYITVHGATAGGEYTFTSNGTGGGYMTIRSGSYDGTVLGTGFSPLSIVSNIDGSLFVHYNVDGYCETAIGTCVISTVQCTSCTLDCPALSANIGDPCDDGNSNTINDMVNASCECVGEIPASGSLSGTADWNDSCGDRNLTVKFYTPGTAALIYTYSTSIDGNGDYSISGIAVGNYDIYAKIDGRLANGYYNKSIIAGSNSLLLGASTAGDLNNNNGINISDFSILNIAFGSSEGDANYDSLADMNCDGNVNIIDVSILNIGFGMVGAQP